MSTYRSASNAQTACLKSIGPTDSFGHAGPICLYLLFIVSPVSKVIPQTDSGFLSYHTKHSQNTAKTLNTSKAHLKCLSNPLQLTSTESVPSYHRPPRQYIERLIRFRANGGPTISAQNKDTRLEAGVLFNITVFRVTSRRERPQDRRRSWLRRPTYGQSVPRRSHPRVRAASPAPRRNPCNRWRRTG